MDAFEACERFTAGTVGEPGHRVFYLQVSGEGDLLTLKVEKEQVAALAQFLAGVLSDLPTPPPDEVPIELDLVEPVEEAWVVGEMAVAYDEEGDRLIVRADELEGDRALRASLTRGQVQAFVVRAATLVQAGRPPCPLCGRPIDPEGHMCIKENGHRKR